MHTPQADRSRVDIQRELLGLAQSLDRYLVDGEDLQTSERWAHADTRLDKLAFAQPAQVPSYRARFLAGLDGGYEHLLEPESPHVVCHDSESP